MADKANRLLEDRARQAEALQQSCAFSQAEIKQTLRARARYEYALKRRRSTAAIFGRYIKFEVDLYDIWRMRQVWFLFKSVFCDALGHDTNTETGCGGATSFKQRHYSWIHDSKYTLSVPASPAAIQRKRRFVVGVRHIFLLTRQLSPAFWNTFASFAV